MLTMNALKVFVLGFALFALSACEIPSSIPPTPEVIETEESRALCQAWRDSLPGRSHRDTYETKLEIGHAYDEFLAACPGFDLPL